MKKLFTLMALGQALSVGSTYAISLASAAAPPDDKDRQQTRVAACSSAATGMKGDARRAFIRSCLSIDGKPPRHSFFYPGEQYEPGYLQPLAELARAGYGEVEVHLHHDTDTEDTLRASLGQALADFSRHGHISRDRAGKAQWAFIHGNWCLANSRAELAQLEPQERELTLVAETSGMVGIFLKEPGDYVTAHEPILQLLDEEQPFLLLQFPSPRISDIAPGTLVDLYFPGGKKCQGRVEEIPPQTSPIPAPGAASACG
jgi:hypothetical protein